MLKPTRVAARLPAQDLERARAWYRDKLGLEPAEERPGGLRYLVGGCEFVVFQSAGASDGSFTQLAFEVADIKATAAALKARGVRFEEYDLPGLRTEDGIATIEGQYPSKGTGERGGWFRDSEGNLIGVGEVLERSAAGFPVS
ncbi:MAG TPA: VOC family protein [Allosphingosinicella sp.]|nr:VOC family protein [Allosphingosinicella sp.]